MKKQPTAPSVAEYYHQSTKYSPENLSDFTPDPGAKPPPFKNYRSDRPIDLKDYLKESSEISAAASEGPSGEDAPPIIEGDSPPAETGHGPFGTKRSVLGSLSRLLYHTGGITGVLESSGGPHYFRAAPSAGALYPTDIYLVSHNLPGIPDSIYYYSVLNHSLVPVWEGDFGMDLEEFCFRHVGATRAKAYLVFTGVFQRSAWRYRERAYRRILLDTGHLLGNAILYAPLEGLRVVTIGGFFDAALNDLMFLDPKEEVVLLVAPILEETELEESPAHINSPFPFPSLRNLHDFSQANDEGVMRLLHRQSGILPDERLVNQVPTAPLAPEKAEKSADRSAEAEEAVQRLPLEKEPAGGAPLATLALGGVIRRRRSTRRLESSPLSFAALGKILAFAHEPARKYWKSSKGLPLQDCVLLDPTLLQTYIVALRVEGLIPGVYKFNDENLELRLVRKGFFQDELFNITLRQELGRDCAAAVFHIADLAQCTRRYGDRAYRYLHLDAGHLGERMNLAAVQMDLGVSGIGGFFDEEINELLELPSSHMAAYITVLGVPAKTTSKAD